MCQKTAGEFFKLTKLNYRNKLTSDVQMFSSQISYTHSKFARHDSPSYKDLYIVGKLDGDEEGVLVGISEGIDDVDGALELNSENVGLFVGVEVGF